MEENNDKLRAEINRLEQVINEVGIAKELKDNHNVNIIDVLNANCKNIISLDDMLRHMHSLVITHQELLGLMDAEIVQLKSALRKHRKADKVVRGLMWLSGVVVIVNVINIIHTLTK